MMHNQQKVRQALSKIMQCFSHPTTNQFRDEFFAPSNRKSFTQILLSRDPQKVVTFGAKFRLLAEDNPNAMSIRVPMSDLHTLLQMCESDTLSSFRNTIWGLSYRAKETSTQLHVWLHPCPDNIARSFAAALQSILRLDRPLHIKHLPNHRWESRTPLHLLTDS